MLDGKAASARWEGLGEVWRSVTGGRVAKMPGGEALGKWRNCYYYDVVTAITTMSKLLLLR